MDFPSRLKKLRKDKGITQQELANALNRDRSTVGGYESERKEPDFETLCAIAEYFDVSLDYILGRTDIKYPYDPVTDDNIRKVIEQLGPQITLQLKDLKDMTHEEKLTLTVLLDGLKARRNMEEETQE